MDQNKFFKNKKITVMGVGLHGGALAVIKWLLKNGATVTATDIKDEKEIEGTLEKLKNLKNLKLVLGKHRKEDFEKADLIIKNPTVPWDNPFVQLAIQNGVPIEMDSSLFFKFCKSKKIIGVTGTKGKTTSSMLLVHALKKMGEKVIGVGIGQESVLDKVDLIDESDWVVFELSSWRLSSLHKLKMSPRYALLTNLYPDHLNYYKTFQEYINDKKNVFLYQKKDDFTVINWDNTISRQIEPEIPGNKVFFATAPLKNQDSVFLEGESVCFQSTYKKESQGLIDVFNSRDLKIYGKHNLYNAMGACALLLKLGFDPEELGRAITSFQGAKHRLEKVAVIDGIEFINDTAATTPEATIAAIESFERPISLICGGADKNLDFDELAKKIADSAVVCGVFLLKGQATEKLKKMILNYRGDIKIIGEYDTLEKAVKNAKTFANQGGLVMLSPGCASFGMFKNEFDRGDQFVNVVNSLK